MKRKLLLTTILAFTLLSSCKGDKSELTENSIEDNVKKTNDLFSFGKINAGFFTLNNNSFYYSINLDAVNQTNNTFEKTIVQSDLKLVLQNDNILSAEDTDKLLNLGSTEKITFWKAGETKRIGKNKELYTRSLPNHFKEYPIKQAVLVLKLTANDIVNKTEQTIIHNIDITEDWKSFLSTKKNLSTKEKKKSFQDERLVKEEEILEQESTRDVRDYTVVNKNTTTKTRQISDFVKNTASSLNGNKSGGDGDDGVAVNKGRKDGSLNSNNYYGDGSRNNESGKAGSSLVGRKAISRPVPQNTCNEAGMIVVRVTVDRNGNVISAQPGIKGSVNSSSCLKSIAKEAAMRSKWEAKEDAPEEQIGSIVYNFKLN